MQPLRQCGPTGMTKKLLIVLALSSLGLAGCVAVPAYDAPYYGGGYAPAPVVVQPAVRFSYYGGYYGGRGYRGRY